MMEKVDQSYSAMISLYAEMFLDDCLREFRIHRLYEEIDCALEQGDAQKFLALTNELKTI